ncbi:MAG TPA: glycine zipper domain-containing protein [Marmoricola sp.]|nr:glycine zipper domain-containing protein [Marmoricola sp.]
MSFQGLDPDVVSRTAGDLERQAAALDSVASHVDALIRTAMHHWSGPEAQDFHQWWVGQHRPRLVAAAQGLHSAAQNVRRQVAEQVGASGGATGDGHPPGLRTAPGNGWATMDLRGPMLGVFDTWLTFGAGPVVAITGTQLFGRFAPRDAAGRFVSPEGSWRQVLNDLGAFKDDRVFTARVGTADQFARWGRAGKVLGPVGTIISVASSGWEQWEQDGSDSTLSNDDRVLRAATTGATTGAGGFAGAWAGAAVGAAVGSVVPGPGTAVGAVVGGVVGGVAGSTAGQELGHLINGLWH